MILFNEPCLTNFVYTFMSRNVKDGNKSKFHSEKIREDYILGILDTIHHVTPI